MPHDHKPRPRISQHLDVATNEERMPKGPRKAIDSKIAAIQSAHCRESQLKLFLDWPINRRGTPISAANRQERDCHSTNSTSMAENLRYGKPVVRLLAAPNGGASTAGYR
jgi:hypothetical protein